MPSSPGGRLRAHKRSREPFTVGDIRIEGLQRISEGTVFNYLPVNIGDHLDGQRIGEAMRALYATGFFRDVELRRDGNTLLVVVVERPSIAKFEIKGNKDIKTEDLQKSLRNVGLAQGKTFDRSVLDEVKQYLTDQYFSRGKYAVRVDTKITELPGNKVDVVVDIKEGKRAKIEQINLVGNTKFKEKDVLGTLELKTPNWLSWYKQDDRYSRESLTGDLEKLRSYYMDRGYANFQIESTQVTIAPEKDDMYITVNVNEGDVFKVSEVKLAGTMVVPEEQLKSLLLIHPGDTFSRKLVTSTQELMSYRLGADGYAFAKIDPVPTPDNVKKTVSLTFFIEPGNRVYVQAHQFQQHHRDQRRNAAPRNAPARRRLAVEFGGRALQGASAAPAVRGEGRVREQAGGGQRRPRGRRLQHQGRIAGTIRRRHRLFGSAAIQLERQFRAQQFHGHRRSHRPGNQRRQVTARATYFRTRIPTPPSTAWRAPVR